MAYPDVERGVPQSLVDDAVKVAGMLDGDPGECRAAEVHWTWVRFRWRIDVARRGLRLHICQDVGATFVREASRPSYGLKHLALDGDVMRAVVVDTGAIVAMLRGHARDVAILAEGETKDSGAARGAFVRNDWRRVPEAVATGPGPHSCGGS